MIYLFSASRSGSTWLGKIFDSHPDVLYLHEPEICDRGMDLLPFWFDREPTEEQVRAAKVYLERLLDLRQARVTGTRPFFRKHYRNMITEWIRRALIYGAKGSERIGLGRLSERVPIPDFRDRKKPMIPVIKSVSALGRADVLIRAAGKSMRPILLIRHPCGYVASMLRGHELGVMGQSGGLGRLLETRSAKNLGADPAALKAADQVDKLAWQWLLANAEAHDAVRAAGGPVVVYDKLALNAAEDAAKLFAEIGLSWTPETAAFVRRSGASDGSYYSVFRDAEKAITSWQRNLDEAVIARIRKTAIRHPIGQMFFER